MHVFDVCDPLAVLEGLDRGHDVAALEIDVFFVCGKGRNYLK